MRNRINSQIGLTFVELLATILIVSIVATLAYTVLFQGYANYKRIKTETELRDEADLIMATIVKEMFVLKDSEIQVKNPCQNTPTNYKKQNAGYNDSFIEISNPITASAPYYIGFIGNQGSELTVKSKIHNSSIEKKVNFYKDTIKLKKNLCNGTENYNYIVKGTNDGEYTIKFTLYREDRPNQLMTFKNTVRVINDKKEANVNE